MRFRLLAVFTLLIAFACADVASASRYRVGIGDQSGTMFSAPAFQKLGIKRVRYLVPWDWRRDAGQRAEVTGFIQAAQANGKEVLVTWTASRGCWVNNRYAWSVKHCRAPSASRYAGSVRAFRKAFPFVKVFAAWNEANHASQPTANSPKRAAGYYNALRKLCRKCTIVAADVLDQSGVERWLRTFRHYAKGSPRRWGLHNYSDVNRKRSSGTRAVLRTVPGELWLTETGGVVKFGSSFPYSPKRAAARTKYMFSLANRYSRKLHGMRSRITRIYPYAWTGVARGARFDAGLTGPNGGLRPAYKVFAAAVRKLSK